MSAFTARNAFPFCIEPAAGIWDGTTRYDTTPGNPYDLGAPSFSSTEYQPVVGPGTEYSAWITIDHLAALYWKVKAWKVTCDVTIMRPNGAFGGDSADSDLTFPLILDSWGSLDIGRALYTSEPSPFYSVSPSAADWRWDGSNEARPFVLRPDIHPKLVCNPDNTFGFSFDPGTHYRGGGPFERVPLADQYSYKTATYYFSFSPFLSVRSFNNLYYPRIEVEIKHALFQALGARASYQGETRRFVHLANSPDQCSMIQAGYWDEDKWENSGPNAPDYCIWSISSLNFENSSLVPPMSQEQIDAEYGGTPQKPPVTCAIKINGFPDMTLDLNHNSGDGDFVSPNSNYYPAGSITIEAHKFHTYGGIYDEDTGQPV